MMLRRGLVLVLAMTIVVPLAVAQRRGGAGFARGTSFSRGTRSSRRGYSAWPYLYPDFYPDSDTTQSFDESNSTPQFVLLRPPANDAPPAPKARPLLIEWRGDHYVRYGGIESNDPSSNPSNGDYSELAGAAHPTSSVAPTPPILLILANGSQQEVADYTIADGVIYAQSRDWSASANQRIPLAALDIKATIAANRERGSKFLLPSASNVVIASF
jgi:hypothetical protein